MRFAVNVFDVVDGFGVSTLTGLFFEDVTAHSSRLSRSAMTEGRRYKCAGVYCAKAASNPSRNAGGDALLK